MGINGSVPHYWLTLPVRHSCQLLFLDNFVSFTPMRHDFSGGFDPFMTGVGLLLIILPVDRCFALIIFALSCVLTTRKHPNITKPSVHTGIFSTGYYMPGVSIF